MWVNIRPQICIVNIRCVNRTSQVSTDGHCLNSFGIHFVVETFTIATSSSFDIAPTFLNCITNLVLNVHDMLTIRSCYFSSFFSLQLSESSFSFKNFVPCFSSSLVSLNQLIVDLLNPCFKSLCSFLCVNGYFSLLLCELRIKSSFKLF